MCGIFGVISGQKGSLSGKAIANLLPPLFKLSEKRGREASGLAVCAEGAIQVYKRAGSARAMLKSADYQSFVSRTLLQPALQASSPPETAVIGHSRLVTNGGRGFSENNQPLVTDHCVGIHNGIVVNDQAIKERHGGLDATSDVDSEVIFRLIEANFKTTKSITDAVVNAYQEIEGAASIAFYHDITHTLTLMTNTGSLYVAVNHDAQVLVFASEPSFVQQVLSQCKLTKTLGKFATRKLQPTSGLSIALKSFTLDEISIASSAYKPRTSDDGKGTVPALPLQIVDATSPHQMIRRCTRCILPASFPLIEFDDNGVCNQCRDHAPRKLYGKEALQKLADQHRKNNGEPDCIVTLSGGRDSSFGLHYVKNELGLNPIAMTYDWGMVTDLARRNQSRMCARLGVEHIIRSPDISVKRRNIRKNLEAWFRRPDLGAMLPLLTAGDKQFYHYPRQLRKEYDLDLVFFAAGSDLERTVFKTAFCGISKDRHGQILGNFPVIDKFRLVAYFTKQFLLNPRYINTSLFDTLWAFFATYVVKDDFTYLFHYIPWDEDKIMSVLREQYDWEASDDTSSTWRIGDGTAAFYNYVYHTVAGFSEYDTFRSNQIRAGLITRDEALKLVSEENVPRYETMREYASLVGFNLDEALMVINSMPKRF